MKNLLNSRLFLAIVAWLPLLAIGGWIYTKVDLPGSIPLYAWLLLRIAGAAATMITAILAGIQVYELTRRNSLSLIVALGVGAVFWTLTTNVVRIIFESLEL